MIRLSNIIIILSLFLVSCDSVRESAGVNRKVIDEYSVVENPPLVIPPNFNLLPPEQIESNKIANVDSELAKEILFGLEDDEGENQDDSSLISEIIEETNANEVDKNIRDIINKEFAGEKSSINDETIFESEDEINAAIEEIENNKNNSKIKNTKEKKKKKFFFF